MADDLSDVYAELRKLQEQVRVLMSANPLENSSVRKGRMRFIGGTLRVDSGGRVEIDGTFVGAGGMTWTGTVTLESTFTQNGPWNLNGPGTIAGDVNQTGDTTQQGNVTLTGGGKLTAGNVRIEGGKIYVGTGASQIVIDGATGTVVAGSMTIDPSANGGSVKFAGGPEVYASGAQLSLYSGTGAFIELNGNMAKINGPGARWVEVNSAGVRFVALPTGAPAGAKAVLIDPATGQLYRAA